MLSYFEQSITTLRIQRIGSYRLHHSRNIIYVMFVIAYEVFHLGPGDHLHSLLLDNYKEY